jgi:hypothetical protein
MITATGKPVKSGADQTSFEIQVGANKGYHKIRTDQSYSFEKKFGSDPTWQRIHNKLKPEAKKLKKMQDTFIQYNHRFNIDETCAFKTHNPAKPYPETGKGALFRSQKDHDYFLDYFQENCIGKQECSVNINKLPWSQSKQSGAFNYEEFD